MRLTVFSDYALRVLIYVALQGERRTTVAEIAEAYNISRSHLMKVVHFLSGLGYLQTVRGKGGGLTLAQPPDAIRIGTLLRKTEADSVMVECMGGEGACRITEACALPAMLERAVESFFATLDGYTLADLVTRPQSLKPLFTSVGKNGRKKL
ncbi:MAG: Rrf2 family transcriptional regulator [Gammaproteobacteria bacterium]|nr:Rrf2 family transcriptional regulator [Gammaproteobacteria bacterium]MCW8841160.1 Rrf2 family transcriptional regulator [Gammaproteobacteria bacterium]MCW8958684.1 Rrf2 family transcriptional regulator [Gammaproteobacteria bacterium]MCW8973565.1 Rrf2 family transcriptional regulator [Gammaproteobacteria bacterium]MCW8993662.1 Rrf2 family transcriptional regulator [Gammaproteobacteria bacterium]